ncbi:Peptidoglycan-associated lipoprotein [Dyadobacter sp. CECT 9623]|uniref:Peptidoglycan-associated lipoprotein n=1 Tax=Dyadobacter linearis TaxID=2823330 RepID=A0ABM8UNN4_9BACT|nr:OmpA family protein [Dyadobacter sp. CECT 9623]CAG5069057.1 Peptidoglycan-associated lipoprotein [Dyadobacter sp. CECT 9623]
MKTPVLATILFLATCATALCQEQQSKKTAASRSKVTIRVLDRETFRPINANILIVSQNAGKQIVPLIQDNNYQYKIPVTDTTTFSIYAPGYETLNESILADEINATEVFYLTPKAAGNEKVAENTEANTNSEFTRPVLREDITSTLYFIQSNTNMAGRSRPELEQVVDYMIRHEDLQIELAGHTDNVGDADKNYVLSVDRASVIRQYLISRNVSPSRIKSKAFGSTMPVAPNDSERNRRFNRRVEIRMKPTIY